jgi:SM-20-related protein
MIALSPGLDATAQSAAFAPRGRLHAPDFLTAESAETLARTLKGLDWTRSVLVNGKPYDLGPEALAALPPDRARELDAAVGRGAREGFQYRFDTWRVSDVAETGGRSGPAPLMALYDLLNGPAFLDWVRGVTGEPACAYVDAQATRYRAGDFLTAHDDDVDGKHRLFAFVLGLSRDWRADWGGLLVFHDADGHLDGGWTPRFNTLNLFRVPQVHSVTQVAGFVSDERLAITGWIRTSEARPK